MVNRPYNLPRQRRRPRRSRAADRSFRPERRHHARQVRLAAVASASYVQVLSQGVSTDLTGGGLRKAVPKFDDIRHLERSDLVSTILDDLFLGTLTRCDDDG